MGCLKHFAIKWKQALERNRGTILPRASVGSRAADGRRAAGVLPYPDAAPIWVVGLGFGGAVEGLRS
jgi:hypothetical protein